MRDFSSIAARFEGAFSDYEIHLSTQMSGYFIITKRGGYSSELIGEEVGELVFKDCTKTSDEIRALITAKQEAKPAPKTSQISPQNDEKTLGFEIVSSEEKAPKSPAFVIDDEPSAPAFSIECEDEGENSAADLMADLRADLMTDLTAQSPKPAFEIIDDDSEQNSDENEGNSRISFEIAENDSDENEGNSRIPFEIDTEIAGNSRIPFEIAEDEISGNSRIPFEIAENDSADDEISENSRIPFEIADDESEQNDEQSAGNSRIPFEIAENESTKIAENKNELNSEQNPANDEIIAPAHHHSQKIFFAKNTEIISAKVVEVELIIHGYDESCDSFSFEKIPPDCEYKYSIKIGELRAIFIATMDADTASEFISGFSFKTERQVPKNIEIFINESVEPVLETTLFA